MTTPKITAMTKVEWGDTGMYLTSRMANAMKAAHRKFHKRYPKVKINLAQGSWHKGTVASAGTHDGAGAADTSIRNLSKAQRIYLVLCYKWAGLCAWYRTTKQGFDPHIHVLDKVTKGMADLAKYQVAQYLAGRTGLRTNARDDTWRAPGDPVWNYQLGKPVPRAA